jgi:hypothetical protein
MDLSGGGSIARETDRSRSKRAGQKNHIVIVGYDTSFQRDQWFDTIENSARFKERGEDPGEGKNSKFGPRFAIGRSIATLSWY